RPARRLPAGAPPVAPRDVLRAGSRQRLAPRVVRRLGARLGPLRLGRLNRARATALLPTPGTAAPHRVGQHPAQRQPRTLGLARPRGRLRPRRTRTTPRQAPLAGSGLLPPGGAVTRSRRRRSERSAPAAGPAPGTRLSGRYCSPDRSSPSAGSWIPERP